MAEVTKNQWDELFHKIDEKIAKLAEETHKNLDSKIENKVNKVAIKSFNLQYLWLAVNFAVVFFIINAKTEPIKEDIQSVKEDVQSVKEDVQSVKEDVQSLTKDVQSLKKDVQSFTSMQYKNLYNIPTKSQKADPTKDTNSRKKASL